MTKEELREDPILERIQRLVGFSERHARWIVIAAIGIAVAIVAVIAVQKSQARSAREANQALSEGQASYLTGNLPMAETQLRELVDRYGRTSAAGQGHLYLGHTLRDQGRPGDALESYEKAAGKMGDDAELQAAAQRGQGAALADLNRFEEASRAYEQAAQKGTLQRVEDTIAAGRYALRGGDAARAQQLLEAIDRRAIQQGSDPNRVAELLMDIDFLLAQAGKVGL
jgi:predicted negative regulator of RcsB-dependent stress response